MTPNVKAARADDAEGEYPLHALDFYWQGFEPGLTCYDSRENEVSEFDLERVDFVVSQRKSCIGYFDDDDKYILCPRNASVTRFAQCAECSRESFLPFQDCVFDPKCEGEKCDLEFCRREHVLYVAFYDTRVKIGMSSNRRVEKRLIEQGADAYAILGTFPNRKRARDTEKEISNRLRLPQFYRQEVLLRNFSRSLDVRGIEGRHEALSITLGEAYGLRPEPIRWLDGYPLELPLSRSPRLQGTVGRHKGRLVGFKGKWLVYEQDGLRALNLSDIEARFLSRESL